MNSDNMDITLPLLPEPTEIEIEVTNFCNAQCYACPRECLSASKGYMDWELFKTIIDTYGDYRQQLKINTIQNNMVYPVVTFAGMGEPLMHPRLEDFIRYAAENRFKTILFSNAGKLDEKRALKIIEAGISEVYLSFWGITPGEYKASMHLDFEKSLRNVENFHNLARKKNIPLMIIWVKTPYIKSTGSAIRNFWEKRGIPVDDENDPWNRGGYLSNQWCDELFKQYPALDFSKEIWCSQLYFTDTVCWNGDVVLCSCDYYGRENILGNIRTHSLSEMAKCKSVILESKKQLDLCRKCCKPDRNYAFGTKPWDELLPPEQKEKYQY